MKRAALLFALLTFTALAALSAYGGAIEGGARGPDGRTAVTCDLPGECRKRNIGSPPERFRGDPRSLGCCVFRSNEYTGRYQNLRELHDLPEKMVQAGIPGGGDPEKLVQVLKKLAPSCVDLCLQHTGGDPAWIKAALKTGRPVAITYCGHDPRYGAQTIAHMVWCAHLDEQWGCILDNNFPDRYLWMPAAELVERWRGVTAAGKPFVIRDERGRSVPVGGGWAVVFTAPTAPPVPRTS